MTISVSVNGFASMAKFLDEIPDRAKKAASLAINQTADRQGLKLIRGKMREQINFPARYLEDPRRLGVTSRAKPENLEAVITGRSRPTSLATFVASGRGGRGAAPVRLRVNPGRTRTIQQAFLFNLRAGTEAGGNVGLAIRLKPGQRVFNKAVMKPFVSGLYLLYGPSVDQIFRTVAGDVAPELADVLLEEFMRQFARLERDGL